MFNDRLPVALVAYLACGVALGGPIALAAAVVSYYGTDALLGMTNGFESSSYRFWMSVALPAGVVMAIVGNIARGTRLPHLVVALLAPAVMVYSATRGGFSGPTQPWSDRIVLIAAAALATGLILRFLRRRGMLTSCETSRG